MLKQTKIMAERQKLVQHESVQEKAKKYEKRIKLRFPERFGKLQPGFDGLINIHNLYDK